MKVLNSLPEFKINATVRDNSGAKCASNIFSQDNTKLNNSLNALAQGGRAHVAFGAGAKDKKPDIKQIRIKAEKKFAPEADKKINAATNLYRDIESKKIPSTEKRTDKGIKYTEASYRDEQGRDVTVYIGLMYDPYFLRYSQHTMLEVAEGKPIRKTYLHKLDLNEPVEAAYLRDYEADDKEGIPNYYNNCREEPEIEMYRYEGKEDVMRPTDIKPASSEIYLVSARGKKGFRLERYTYTTDDELRHGQFSNFEKIELA